MVTFASRTGQFATINGTALGNGKQFTPAYSATNLSLNVAAPTTHSAAPFDSLRALSLSKRLRVPAPAQGNRIKLCAFTCYSAERNLSF